MTQRKSVQKCLKGIELNLEAKVNQLERINLK